jgi:signal transduction histidine kinase
LALVKYIVSAHGGEIWASSQLHQGSTFGFRIPLGQPSTQASADMSLIMSNRDQLWGR